MGSGKSKILEVSENFTGLEMKKTKFQAIRVKKIKQFEEKGKRREISEKAENS